MRNKIKEQYINYILENGHEPESIFKFSKKIKIKEDEFYENFNSFVQINAEFWKDLVEETLAEIQTEGVYEGYSVREKLLSFLFTLIENLKRNRSFILKIYEKADKPLAFKSNAEFINAKEIFVEFMNDLVVSGQESREIEPRSIPFLTAKYPDLIWVLVLAIIEFWIKDESRVFEKTDTLIEKSVNTAMDWMGRTPFDSLFDLGKFLFQNR
ncbi:TetR/AcrR family transcriptional regulator [Lacihabitans sp. LS3-19]|uniref:TetR family transcriptional regulator C-terminal domain-containing protein n=1 Tax=Lacihabitans sp. LS3-19 TaxID=2487335 RepID=UPI0020CBC188|nr:TetR family transcriptional regulator C-terminal domain-containing protein [Lacihabitans sp. LS3-19]MCP9769626.1 TetR/AcrR family transcriptional regulator [Lacihabitans sp. LS3-19]